MEGKRNFTPNPKLELMEQVRETLRYYHYAYRTEKTYCDWIVRYVKFYGLEKHPREMGAAEVERYLSHLASVGQVAAATQRHGVSAFKELFSRES